MTILITGATGTVSGALLRSLSMTAGTRGLRVLIRDPARAPSAPGLDVVVGDLDEPSGLAAAFDSVDVLWLLTAMGPDAPHAAMNAVWAARQAGVKHIVRLSAIGAAYDAPTRNGRLHALSEAEIRASGMGWTIIRPHFFLQNLFGSVAGSTLYGAVGDGRLGMIDVRDIADFGARVLTDPAAHASRTYTVTGPESVRMDDVAAAFGPALGAQIRYQPLTSDQAFEAMLGAGLPPWNAAVNVEYAEAYAGGWGDVVTTDFTDVVGRPARTVADFARDHAALLRS